MDDTKARFRKMINETLPATYQQPVRFNHCFNRIILDWLFQDVWYNHLNRNQTAISQLNDEQCIAATLRMNEWIVDRDVFIKDNINSLHYRKKQQQ